MASIRDIKKRRAGIENTQQITKAMKLVATIKLQKARIKAESSKPYTLLMYQTIKDILSCSEEPENPYLMHGRTGKSALIVITGNRGLAGGYNQNIVRMILAGNRFKKEDTLIYALGRKGKDSLKKKGYSIEEDYSEVINLPLYQDALDVAMELLDSYKTGKIKDIYLIYTAFKSTAVHVPTMVTLLPLEPKAPEAEKESPVLMNYEPDSETVLHDIMPQYLGSLIYGALLESAASEHGARMTAMDTATANAEDMMGILRLQYNRARQGTITQELTEIIAGANAISL